MIGERLGPYRIVELLGRGGLCEVYRAYHQEESREVALKILQTAPDKHTRARFAREAEALKVLDHPNIVEILLVGEHQERPYYTMPFVRVQSLQEVMHQRFQVDQGSFSQDEMVRILLDLSRALSYAHSQGIIHRDVKPGNILLDASFRPVLCDFGLARLAGAETVTRHGTMVGTPRYISPEQLQGRSADCRSDLYSLGLVAYEMATRAIPFDSGEPLAAAVRRLSEPIPPVHSLAPDLDSALSDLIMSLLEMLPTERPQAASEVVTRLAGFPGAPPPLSDLDAASVPGDPPPPSDSLTPKPSRSVFLGTLGVLVVALAIAGWLWFDGQNRLEVSASCRVEPFADHAILDLQANRPVKLAVQFGPPGRMAGFKETPGVALEHRLELDGLMKDSEYSFSVRLEDASGHSHQDPPRRFRTAMD